ncbi:hypothetical protein DOTSEDRAFT_24135 [Dothistroma septosporum NZE10]|uniref:Uncharacterized protein n=1 Tax=Dothistroma septosporum (strain NZE10 / CBS 128990) TaxID=675120 RepID=N1PKL1_DOTSN|nr:hypothetical protein DOTSEDRAFT_24135 [Dothistroma septosporum NZE10]
MAEVFPFFSLPQELRDFVYSYTMQRRNSKTCCFDVHYGILAFNCLTVSRQISKEYCSSQAVTRLTFTETGNQKPSGGQYQCWMKHKEPHLPRAIPSATHLEMWLARLLSFMKAPMHANIRINVRCPELSGWKANNLLHCIELTGWKADDLLHFIEQIRLELNKGVWIDIGCPWTIEVHYAKSNMEYWDFSWKNSYMALSADTREVRYCGDGAEAALKWHQVEE